MQMTMEGPPSTPGERKGLSLLPEASLSWALYHSSDGRQEKLLVIWVHHNISNHFSVSWSSPLDPLPSTFLLSFSDPREMLSECFQFIYAQFIKMPFYKSCLTSERSGKLAPGLFICEKQAGSFC